MSNKIVIVGSRGSQLALAQTQQVVDQLRQRYPDRQFQIKTIRTSGDRPVKHLPWGVGVFVKELEDALAGGDIDMAIHSLKDLPTLIDPKLALAAMIEREDPRDVLVSRWRCTLTQLPKGARLGTSSPRRVAQLLAFRADFQVQNLSGNIDTRLRKAQDEEWDGVIIAAAGLIRLGLQNQITEYIPSEVCLPAVGQGALVLEIRSQDEEMARLASAIDDLATRQAVAAERTFLHAMGGGCHIPVAALGQVKEELLEIEGVVARRDGSQVLRTQAKGDAKNPEELGRNLAEKLLAMGAKAVLEEGNG
ncbi:MAG: hydroxymethylbilane synthase [Chloroflexi bacterium]|nr:hydroxymethylbilane synthase [Chloroflexota bacterium]